ncbi:hypothetical protein BABINDRAFT_160806 [Babjeviella inositovora NRRL Y-12698]|uniref:W2 domain-containing protein n=1 Tax=Babjeviella inositovora NRRL Y-12698 TaxID=984486 RepID=A0A1E3QS58_9ASCO|nr:uncharacterized protein BABINDRAFT_160806 [Babjeviella inositovora NRRL Y-12698]ODQ80535.1 hypothetical protein BABINDRAFT_160806 [Babjeviella inositovora NRRL Y-12698]
MSFINICRDNTDPFYRYKMPSLQSKIEGRGNGIKTAVVNLSEVSRALARPPNYVLKYLGYELGAQTKPEANDRYLVNGQHDAPKLQDLLDGFISKFVLCGSCKNPETEIVVAKDDTLIKDCKACGQRTSIDPRAKLSSYIIKNPPESGKGKKSATASANVVGGGVTISDLASGRTQGAEAADVDEDYDDDALTRKINAEASALPEAHDIADDEWAVDMSEEAVRARALELEAVSLDSKAVACNEFGEWLLSFDKAELPSDVEIYKKASELSIVGNPDTVQVLAQTLFDNEIVTQLKQHAGLLNKLMADEDNQKAFLGGLERYLGLENQALIPALPKILMTIYDLELIEEDVIQNWGTKVSKKYVAKDISKKVRKAAKPFLKWLEEAEEDSDDE